MKYVLTEEVCEIPDKVTVKVNARTVEVSTPTIGSDQLRAGLRKLQFSIFFSPISAPSYHILLLSEYIPVVIQYV